MANRYWVGGSATWDATNPAVWSNTPGGTGGQSVPTAGDSVYFSAGTAITVTLSGNLACYDLIIAGTSSAQITFVPAAAYTLNCTGPNGSASYVTFRGAFPTAGSGKIDCVTGVNVLSVNSSNIARISNFIGNYNYAIILTSGTSFTTPSFIPATNSIEMIGGGGGGGAGWRSGSGTGVGGWGGGGGAYTKLSNVPLLPNQTYSYSIGSGGTGGSPNFSGRNGEDTSITIDGNSYIASGGDGGRTAYIASSGSTPGGVAQALGNLVAASFKGGNGGRVVGGSGVGAGGGGGGGAGPNGAGGDGAYSWGGSTTPTVWGGGGGGNGGGGAGSPSPSDNGPYAGSGGKANDNTPGGAQGISGSNGSGGGGGTYTIIPGNGSNGREWFGLWGSGGAAGGRCVTGKSIPGLYGAGGHGGGSYQNAARDGGDGAKGIIVVQLAYANVLVSDVETPVQSATNTGLGFLQIMGLKR